MVDQAPTGAKPRSIPDLVLMISRIMTRDQFFAGLFIVACANGLAGIISHVLGSLGSFEALLVTFNVSVVVWIACVVGPWLLLKSNCGDEVTTADSIIGLIALGLILVPIGKLSWLALTALALYALRNSQPGSPRRRGSLIMLAVTGPMLWGPFLMAAFAQTISRADAIIVANLIGTNWVGNVLNFAHETKTFQVAPACSSLHGISLAILAWMTISQAIGRTSPPKGIGWCLLAACSVVAVNDIRLGLIGLFPDYFDRIHGFPGAAIASWLSLALILMICLLGIRREIFATR